MWITSAVRSIGLLMILLMDSRTSRSNVDVLHWFRAECVSVGAGWGAWCDIIILSGFIAGFGDRVFPLRFALAGRSKYQKRMCSMCPFQLRSVFACMFCSNTLLQTAVNNALGGVSFDELNEGAFPFLSSVMSSTVRFLFDAHADGNAVCAEWGRSNLNHREVPWVRVDVWLNC